MPWVLFNAPRTAFAIPVRQYEMTATSFTKPRISSRAASRSSGGAGERAARALRPGQLAVEHAETREVARRDQRARLVEVEDRAGAVVRGAAGVGAHGVAVGGAE